MVSFATYPGQTDSQNEGRNVDLSDRNYLPYLKKSYQNRDWQGWLLDDRFKGRKAVVVYEYETWHNQSTYMYPAMAKYFRAQGAQVATMWTYYLYDNTKRGLHRTAPHNLNMVTTPRKAASFLVAGQIFKETPRYVSFETTEEDADRFGNAAFSFPLDLSAYATDDLLIHTGDLNRDFVKLPHLPKRIAGYGSSPFVQYEGEGMYFLEAGSEQEAVGNAWTLKVMPHAEFIGKGEAVVDREKAFPITLNLPDMELSSWEVVRIGNEDKTPVPTKLPAITFEATPGDYAIVKKNR